jgi:uncharacterized protein (DUF2147 family)
MKLKSIIMSLTLFTAMAAFGDNFVGLWTTIDDETKEKKSVVQIYKHENMYFGRIVHLYNKPEATAKLPGNPKILGLDIIWNMSQKKERLQSGKILDPKKGSVYSCEIWREAENLIVRGKIAFLGRNQTWIPHQGTELSNTNSVFTPQIPVK